MIINNAPANEAVLSNVGEIGEFRIRNSAKAFSILSSGLYANKIRAIIRELSCNAVDSHTAAGRQSTPFDVHLPTQLDPTFSIRDYGTGLSHEQVTNIYTTYFESTKTESNDFIGALGLGSKSPFSYTDNFTVTAIRDGRKGVYTAFINEAGVPSIALMTEEASTDPSGVEIKFAVESRYDFHKFVEEAQHVYTYFQHRPVVSGPDFEFRDVTYETRDLIPGVHVTERGRSRAVMGNIAYPIDVPNAETALQDLAVLLNCGLEMHFAIGELDFQASREGLSYIPSTIEAIRRKLMAVNSQLAVHVATEADAIDNLWDRATWLHKKNASSLWGSAVIKYVTDTKFDLIDATNQRYLRQHVFHADVDALAAQFNIALGGFSKSRSVLTCSGFKPGVRYDSATPGSPAIYTWDIPVHDKLWFVVTDTKVGAIERAKHHWRKTPPASTGHGDDSVFVLSPVDRTKPMQTQQFFDSIKNPPAARILLASSLTEKERKAGAAGMGANVSVLSLQRRGYGGYHRERELVWKDAGKADSFDSTKIHYYLPLSGFNVISSGPDIVDMRRFNDVVTESGIAGLHGIAIHGVRKADLDWVKAQANWVNVQDHIRAVLAKIDPAVIAKCAAKSIDLPRFFRYNDGMMRLLPSNSMLAKFLENFRDVDQCGVKKDNLERLCRDYATPVDVDSVVKSLVDQLTAIRMRYPLLGSLRDYDINPAAVAQYINLIDKEA
jgi:hypothetical protein